MRNYIGILDGRDDVWGIIIPDWPGCHGGGATMDAAIADATSALREFAAHRPATGEPMPEPRTPEAIRADPEYQFAFEGPVTFAVIPLVLDKGKPVRANLSIDAGVLEAIDEAARRAGVTRSAFIVSAALEKLGAT